MRLLIASGPTPAGYPTKNLRRHLRLWRRCVGRGLGAPEHRSNLHTGVLHRFPSMWLCSNEVTR
ncbi:MAG: hypothetical protein VX257_04925, partial [Planctomycetota bacterium]|nr:hypothetical protein [Planctomycetota bacterium]